MNTAQCLEIVNDILKKDEAFFAKQSKEHGAATFCANCGQNTHVGLYPSYHTKQRRLCSKCAPDYVELLKGLKLWD